MQTYTINLSSTASMQRSLEAIRCGFAGLNEHRKKVLERVPNTNDWGVFAYNSITIKDIAYLSSATHHEFALLRGKTRDIIFHGNERRCEFTEELLILLKSKKLRLIAHTHPDYSEIEPSEDDRAFLRYINQKKSIIISYITGTEMEFTDNIFNDYMGGGKDNVNS